MKYNNFSYFSVVIDVLCIIFDEMNSWQLINQMKKHITKNTEMTNKMFCNNMVTNKCNIN